MGIRARDLYLCAGQCRSTIRHDGDPFLQAVDGKTYKALHPADGYYESNAYPVRSSKEAGAILVAGSDAPDRDILKLADENHAENLRNAHVLETWFVGRRVYKRGLTK